MSNEKLSNKEALAAIVTLILNFIVLSSNKIIIKNCDSASLINCVYISLIALALVLIICKLLKNFSSKSILDISEYVGGKTLKFIVGIAFVAYFTFVVSILLRKTCESLQIIFFPMTDIVFIMMLFVITAGIVTKLKNLSVFKSNLLNFPFLLGVLLLVFVGNFKNFDVTNVFPILGNGVNATFLSGLKNIVAYSCICYLYFIPKYLKKPATFKKISLYAIAVCSVFLLVISSTILFMFHHTLSSGELFPMYIAVRYIEFGTFFQRLDSAFLLVCSLAFVSYFSINSVICTNILKDICNLEDRKPLVYPYLLLIYSIALTIKKGTDITFIENNIFIILFVGIGIIFSFLILLIANIKKKNLITGGNKV